MDKLEDLIVGALAAVLFVAMMAGIVLLIAALYAVSGCVFGFFWNWLAPIVWHAAPHLGWKAAGALGLLVGAAQWLLGRSTSLKE